MAKSPPNRKRLALIAKHELSNITSGGNESNHLKKKLIKEHFDWWKPNKDFSVV